MQSGVNYLEDGVVVKKSDKNSIQFNGSTITGRMTKDQYREFSQ